MNSSNRTSSHCPTGELPRLVDAVLDRRTDFAALPGSGTDAALGGRETGSPATFSFIRAASRRAVTLPD